VTGDDGHYAAVVMELEARGAKVVPIFAGGLDFSGPVERFFINPLSKTSLVDCVVSLTGFALVGGPASQDHPRAVQALMKLDVPYLVALPLVFQTTEEWLESSLGLHPIQVALQVALPELDGGLEPIVFSGRDSRTGQRSTPSPPPWYLVPSWALRLQEGSPCLAPSLCCCCLWTCSTSRPGTLLPSLGCFPLPPETGGFPPSRTLNTPPLFPLSCVCAGKSHALYDRIEQLCTRAIKWAELKRKPKAEKKLAITVFSFPPTRATWGRPPTSTSSPPSTPCSRTSSRTGTTSRVAR